MDDQKFELFSSVLPEKNGDHLAQQEPLLFAPNTDRVVDGPISRGKQCEVFTHGCLKLRATTR
jgi:hypothetical protein